MKASEYDYSRIGGFIVSVFLWFTFFPIALWLTSCLLYAVTNLGGTPIDTLAHAFVPNESQLLVIQIIWLVMSLIIAETSKSGDAVDRIMSKALTAERWWISMFVASGILLLFINVALPVKKIPKDEGTVNTVSSQASTSTGSSITSACTQAKRDWKATTQLDYIDAIKEYQGKCYYKSLGRWTELEAEDMERWHERAVKNAEEEKLQKALDANE